MYDQLESFAAVVELHSMNKASEALNLSQPALSRKIASLEEQLGVKLFYRKGKRLELTRIGQLTYEHAVRMRDQHREFLGMLADYKSPRKPLLTIGASLTTLQSTLPDLLAFLNKRSGSIDIKVATGKTHEIVELVRARKVDVGVVAQAVTEPGVASVPLFEDRLTLIAPSQHPFAAARCAELQDLNGLPMILFSEGTLYRRLTDELFTRSGIVPDVRMEIDSFEAIIRLASTCGFATLLPKSYLSGSILANNGLADIKIAELEQTRRVTSLIYGDLEALSPPIGELIRLVLREYVRSEQTPR